MTTDPTGDSAPSREAGAPEPDTSAGVAHTAGPEPVPRAPSPVEEATRAEAPAYTATEGPGMPIGTDPQISQIDAPPAESSPDEAVEDDAFDVRETLSTEDAGGAKTDGPPTATAVREREASGAADAKASIAELMTDLDVRRVVVVDDLYDEEREEAALALMVGQLDQLREQIKSIIGDHPDQQLFVETDLDDEDTMREALEERFLDTHLALRAALANLVAQDLPATGLGEVSELGAILGDHAEFRPCSVAQWIDEGGAAVVAEEGLTVVFFDLDLNGRLENRGDGLTLLEAFVEETGNQNVIAGLFTNEALDIAAEIKHADEIRAQKQRFVGVLGKFRTESIADFADGLRAFLLTRDLAALHDHTCRAIADTQSEVLERVRRIGYYTLMAAAEAARQEGNVEASGVLRIAEAHHRRIIKEKFLQGILQPSLERIRRAAEHPLTQWLDAANDFTSQVVWDEKFDSAGFLARTHAPLELGDIFQMQSEEGVTTFWMLVMQPCDLMVRKKGERSNAPSHFTLCRVLEVEEPVAPRRVTIGQFVVGSSATWAVDLTARRYIPTQILDATAFTDDGSSVLSASISLADGMSQGMPKLAQAMQKWMRRRVKIAAQHAAPLVTVANHPKTAPATKDKLLESASTLRMGVLGVEFVEGQIACTIDENALTIVSSVRRHSRLVETNARAVLQAWASYSSRPDMPGALQADAYVDAEKARASVERAAVAQAG